MLLNILKVIHQKKVEAVNPLKMKKKKKKEGKYRAMKHKPMRKDVKYRAQDPSGFTPSGPVTYKRANVSVTTHNSQGMTRMPYNVADK